MIVTDDMLIAAMKQAVKLGIFPKFTDEETYLQHWDSMRKVLEAAFEESVHV